MVKTIFTPNPHSIGKTQTMSTWLNMAAIASGGAIGAVSRYLITRVADAFPGGSTMLGTTIANVLGCAALGALIEYSFLDDTMSERLRLALRVGFLGGLTTFSTFAAESAAMAGSGRWGGAGFFVAANLFIGWAALLVGASLVKGWIA